MGMFVIKRDGRKEPVKFDKITARINKLSYGLNPRFCDPVSLSWCWSCLWCSRARLAGDAQGVRQWGWRAKSVVASLLKTGCAGLCPCAPALHTRPRPRSLLLNATQVLVAQKVAAGVYRGVTTSELDELAAETAASLTSTHPDYALVRLCGCRVCA